MYVMQIMIIEMLRTALVPPAEEGMWAFCH